MKKYILIATTIIILVLTIWLSCNHLTKDKNYEPSKEIEYSPIDSYRDLCVPITGEPCP